MNYREKYVSSVLSKATRAFENHAMQQLSERHWTLRKPRSEMYAVDIVSLVSEGMIVVAGDISTAVFAVGPTNPTDRLFWLADMEPHGDRFLGKARIGSSNLVEVYDPDAAREDLTRLSRRYQEASLGELEKLARDLWSEAEKGEAYLREQFNRVGEEMPDIGKVIKPNFIYAWAAVKRLVSLINGGENEN